MDGISPRPGSGKYFFPFDASPGDSNDGNNRHKLLHLQLEMGA